MATTLDNMGQWWRTCAIPLIIASLALAGCAPKPPRPRPQSIDYQSYADTGVQWAEMALPTTRKSVVVAPADILPAADGLYILFYVAGRDRRIVCGFFSSIAEEVSAHPNSYIEIVDTQNGDIVGLKPSTSGMSLSQIFWPADRLPWPVECVEQWGGNYLGVAVAGVRTAAKVRPGEYRIRLKDDQSMTNAVIAEEWMLDTTWIDVWIGSE